MPKKKMTMDTQRSKRTDYIWLLILLIIGLAPRLYLFHSHQVIDSDGAYYAMLGKNLFSGAGYTEPGGNHQWYYPPLYPVNIGLIWLLSGNLEFSSKLVSLILGSLCILLVYLISKKIYSRRTAVIAGILVALHPNLIRFSSTDTAESQFTFLLLLIVLLTLYAFQSTKISLFCLTGAILGMLFLSKPAGIQYFVAYIMLLCVVGLIKKWKKTMIFKRVTAITIIFFVFAFPYLLYLKNHYGFWTLSELTTQNLAYSLLLYSGDNPEKFYQLNSDGTEMRYFTSSNYPGDHLSFFKLFKEEPLNFIKRYARNCQQEIILMFDSIKIFMVAILIFLYFNFFSFKWGSHRLIDELILMFVFFPLATAPLISTHSIRWLLPMIPVLLIWSANGISELQQRTANGFQGQYHFLRNSLTVTILICWIFGTTTPLLAGAKRYAEMYPHEHKKMGLWMKEHLTLPDSTIVMSPSPHVSFYANLRLKIMPWGTTGQIIDYARHHNAQYMVIDDHFLGQARSQKHLLKHIESKKAEIELIKTIIHKKDKSIKLYKLSF